MKLYLLSSRDICIYLIHIHTQKFNCAQVCATSTKVTRRESEIRVSANRGVDGIHTARSSVGVEPFSSFSCLDRTDNSNEEEIIQQSGDD